MCSIALNHKAEMEPFPATRSFAIHQLATEYSKVSFQVYPLPQFVDAFIVEFKLLLADSD